MMAARAQGLTPGQEPQSNGKQGGSGGQTPQGVGEGGVELPAGADLPEFVKQMRPEDWAKLPPKVAQGLLDAQRENTSSEYRTSIEAYFRIIAERARGRKPAPRK